MGLGGSSYFFYKRMALDEMVRLKQAKIVFLNKKFPDF